MSSIGERREDIQSRIQNAERLRAKSQKPLSNFFIFLSLIMSAACGGKQGTPKQQNKKPEGNNPTADSSKQAQLKLKQQNKNQTAAQLAKEYRDTCNFDSDNFLNQEEESLFNQALANTARRGIKPYGPLNTNYGIYTNFLTNLAGYYNSDPNDVSGKLTKFDPKDKTLATKNPKLFERLKYYQDYANRLKKFFSPLVIKLQSEGKLKGIDAKKMFILADPIFAKYCGGSVLRSMTKLSKGEKDPPPPKNGGTPIGYGSSDKRWLFKDQAAAFKALSQAIDTIRNDPNIDPFPFLMENLSESADKTLFTVEGLYGARKESRLHTVTLKNGKKVRFTTTVKHP